MGYILALLGLALIILLHEYGHYIAAKKSGIVVERFGIGMGPTIKIGKYAAHWYRGGTEFCLCWIPIGGFCQLKGEDDDEKGEGTFNSASPMAKFWVSFSGPFANFLTAFAILFIIFSFLGNPLQMQVHELTDGYPAIEAGILPGDIIIGVNDIQSEKWAELQPTISENPGQPITLTIQRDHDIFTTNIVPKDDEGIGMLGVVLTPSQQPVGFVKSVQMSLTMMKDFFVELIRFVGKAVTGNLGGVQVTGPVGIIKMAGESANASAVAFLFFVAFLSLNLGIFNLFPIPPLDGGKIVFAAYEGITKRSVNKKVELTVSTIGFMLLIGILLIVTYKDIVGLFLS
ncbi:MAG: RIP metalloprotease RseP [Caldisericia bacterium]|nr:RIP metalloprotease RseP [Caldisericia bacterium]MDD4614652.1 RIP metalloprotease RseP [Caldisericia bacterium]